MSTLLRVETASKVRAFLNSNGVGIAVAVESDAAWESCLWLVSFSGAQMSSMPRETFKRLAVPSSVIQSITVSKPARTEERTDFEPLRRIATTCLQTSKILKSTLLRERLFSGAHRRRHTVSRGSKEIISRADGGFWDPNQYLRWGFFLRLQDIQEELAEHGSNNDSAGLQVLGSKSASEKCE